MDNQDQQTLTSLQSSTQASSSEASVQYTERAISEITENALHLEKKSDDDHHEWHDHRWLVYQQYNTLRKAIDDDIDQGYAINPESEAALEKLRLQYLLIAFGPNGPDWNTRAE